MKTNLKLFLLMNLMIILITLSQGNAKINGPKDFKTNDPSWKSIKILGDTYHFRSEKPYEILNGKIVFEEDIFLGYEDVIDQIDELIKDESESSITSIKLNSVDDYQPRMYGIQDKIKLWTDGEVIYEFDQEVSLPQSLKNNFLTAMQEWSDATLDEQGRRKIKFIERNQINANRKFIRLTSHTENELCACCGIAYTVGMPEGKWDYIKIGHDSENGCNPSTARHEIGHALGLKHEQSRPNRDQFVNIHWANVKDGMQNGNFGIFSEGDSYGTNYDYMSIMHYGKTAQAKEEGLTTITRKGNPDAPIGGAILSALDKVGINNMYRQVVDFDEDGVWNQEDNCPNIYNLNQADENGNGIGDECEYPWLPVIVGLLFDEE